MKSVKSIFLIALSVGVTLAQTNTPIAQNAALRYWSAFSEIQDSGITNQQAKELNAILDGTAPYDDSKYGSLLARNKLALAIMARGSLLRNCDWGLDYGLGSDTPVEYARKALVLGRLNVLDTFHLLKTGDAEGAVHALVAGLQFSHDVSNGGSLLATLIAKSLLVAHLRAVTGALHLEQISSAQRSELRTAVAALGGGLDWPMAAKRDLEALRSNYVGNPPAAAALNGIVAFYVAAVNDESKLPALNQALKAASPNLADVIPNVKRVLEQKQDLQNVLQQTRSALQQ